MKNWLRALSCAFVATATVGLPMRANADIIVASFATSSILKYSDSGTPLGTLVTSGSGGLNQVSGITVGTGGVVYASSQGSNQILKYDANTGNFLGVFANLSAGYSPAGLKFGPDGNLYVSQYGAAAGAGTVDKFDGSSGAFLGSVLTGLTQPTGLLFGPGGTLYASNIGGGNVSKFNGSQSDFIAAGSSPLLAPSGLTVGPDGNFYVVDLFAGQIRKYNPAGAYLGDFTTGGNMIFPSDLMFDNSGNLLVAVLGPDYNPTGSVQRFNGVTGAYIDDFASGIVTASQLAFVPVPEPSTLLLTGIGLAVPALLAYRRRRAQKS